MKKPRKKKTRLHTTVNAAVARSATKRAIRRVECFTATIQITRGILAAAVDGEITYNLSEKHPELEALLNPAEQQAVLTRLDALGYEVASWEEIRW